MAEVQSEIADVAEKILVWAREHRALADDFSTPPLPPREDVEIFPNPNDPEDLAEVQRSERALERLKIVAVAVDEDQGQAVVLTKNQISSTAAKQLPEMIDGVRVEYVGHAGIEPNPPVLAHAAVAASPRCFLHNQLLACGSSITAAPIWGAGTLGALIRLHDGTLCGLTNNHVTGGCNHTQLGMHILCPAPIDADPTHPAPIGIGRHHSFVPLASGDPRQVQLQDLDVAIFEVTQPDALTSMQGASFFDTPSAVVDPIGGMPVKKVGRTTGLTDGVVRGVFTTPLGVPYQGDRFRSTVYFQNAWAITTSTGEPFSMPGDSGSLVVTADGSAAVGLIFAGATNGAASYMIPVRSVLNQIGATLVDGHNA